jgi:hypothetical protein
MRLTRQIAAITAWPSQPQMRLTRQIAAVT